MGLTIHYSLKLKTNSVPEVRKQVELLRQAAAKLPFQKIFELKELRGKKACDYKKYPTGDDNRWFCIMASPGQFVPTHIIGFDALVGDGCESLNMAFAKRSQQGWMATGFCKTQYASNPEYGGVENFLRCHLSIIQLIDTAKELGFEVEVSDEGNYWEKRDLKALVQEIGDWNVMIAGFAGAFKDALGKTGGGVLEAPITAYPNFERLEAEGAGEKATPAVKMLQKL